MWLTWSLISTAPVSRRRGKLQTGNLLTYLKKLNCCLIKPLNSSGLVFLSILYLPLPDIYVPGRSKVNFQTRDAVKCIYAHLLLLYIIGEKKTKKSPDRKICITRRSLVDTNDNIFQVQRKTNFEAEEISVYCFYN